MRGGRIFLRQDNSVKLGGLIPKLFSLGKDNWEAHALIGKWAFSVEAYEQAESELALSDDIRRGLRPCPPADPAASYLRGILFFRQDKHRDAHPFFAEAARLAPDYGLFRFRLAENRSLK